MNSFIVDDEQPAREELRWLLDQCEGVSVVGEAADADQARTEIDVCDEPVDVVFLDIDMPGIDGIQFAEYLRELDDQPATVFVTAYDDYAVDAFGVEAVDYLLKPVRLERLQEAVERVRNRNGADPTGEQNDGGSEAESLNRISVDSEEGYRVFDLEEIFLFESDQGKVFVETDEGRFGTDFSLKFLESRLPAEEFFRCHRSYIVRLGAIETIVPAGAGTYRLFVERGEDESEHTSAPLARSRAGELKRRMPWSTSALGD